MKTLTVLCDTFNQKDYITDAIESFLKQKTDFEFDIWIHDDASTDGTLEILDSYESKYPDKIRIFREEKNKYSRGIDFVYELAFELQSKYVALCDGDDYWISDNKLQRQVEILESRQDVYACGTESILYDLKNPSNLLYWGKYRHDVEFPAENLIKLGTVIKPSSWCLRTSEFKAGQEFIRKLGGNADSQWYFWIATSQKKVFYISEPMVLYRFNVPGSWTTVNRDCVYDGSKILLLFDELTEKQYSSLVNQALLKSQLLAIKAQRETHSFHFFILWLKFWKYYGTKEAIRHITDEGILWQIRVVLYKCKQKIKSGRKNG